GQHRPQRRIDRRWDGDPRDHGTPDLRHRARRGPRRADEGRTPRPPRILDQQVPLRRARRGRHPITSAGGLFMGKARNVSVTPDVPVRMRDGVTLYADVYAPDGDGPFPVLLMRTPYNKTAAQDSVYAHPRWYACHGYIVVIQDTRGRWSS